MNFDFILKELKKITPRRNRRYVISYPNTELESKIDYEKIKTPGVKTIIDKLKSNSSVEFDEVVRRKEFHHQYKKGLSGRTFIFLRGSKGVWIKEKTASRILYSKSLKIPIITRQEQKLKPADKQYHNLFLKTLNWNYIGSFLKESLDISFWFKNFLFTLTFANAVKNNSTFSQIELEYDGHSSLKQKPTKKAIIGLFDEIVNEIIPSRFRCFTIITKTDWLIATNTAIQPFRIQEVRENNIFVNKSNKSFTGLHVLGEITTKEVGMLKSINQARKHIRNVIKKYNLHELGSFYYKFPGGGGFTGLVSLVESHISIHTWPELKYLTLDVYLCNYSRDNSATVKKVFSEIVAFFGPSKIIKRNIKR